MFPTGMTILSQVKEAAMSVTAAFHARQPFGFQDRCPFAQLDCGVQVPVAPVAPAAPVE
jgi:hypothetical protein